MMSSVSGKWGIVLLGAVGLLLALFILFGDDLRHVMHTLVHAELSPGLFLFLFFLLPLMGAPVLPFYVLLGIRFGISWGMLIMALMLPVHLALSYHYSDIFL